MAITIRLKRLSYSIVWVMTLLEGVTVPLVVFGGQMQAGALEMKAPWQGFIIGSMGAFCIFWLINYLIKKLTLTIAKEQIIAIKPVVAFSFWGGFILFVLFSVQQILALFLVDLMPIVYLALQGFLSLTLTLLIVMAAYSLLTKYFTCLNIRLYSKTHGYCLKSLPFIGAAILFGFYEGIALPIIWEIYAFSNNALISGLLGGFVGSFLMVMLYNFCFRDQLAITFIVEANDT